MTAMHLTLCIVWTMIWAALLFRFKDWFNRPHSDLEATVACLLLIIFMAGHALIVMRWVKSERSF